MKRRIIHIDESRCNGCGLCAAACHEGAIEMVDGKARLTREDYCDGLGDCLPACPAGAITFEERRPPPTTTPPCWPPRRPKRPGRPPALRLSRQPEPGDPTPGGERRPRRRGDSQPAAPVAGADQAGPGERPLVRRVRPAHCRRLHRLRLRRLPPGLHPGEGDADRCPKLDEGDYTEKLTAILAGNDVRSVTVARMTVPCCGGIQRAAEAAVSASGKQIPLHVAVISPDGAVTART